MSNLGRQGVCCHLGIHNFHGYTYARLYQLKVFCFHCMIATKCHTVGIWNAKADSAFISTGFSKWKKALEIFKNMNDIEMYFLHFLPLEMLCQLVSHFKEKLKILGNKCI